MKKLLFVASFILVSICLNAQDDYKTFGFGVGLNTSFAVGDLSNTSSFGRGINLQTAYRFNSKSEISLQLNSDYFGNTDIFSRSLLCLNGLIGGRYHIIPKYLVVGGGVGYGLLIDEDGNSEGGLAFSPEIGVSTRKIQIMLHYTSTNTTNLKAGLIGFRTTYFF